MRQTGWLRHSLAIIVTLLVTALLAGCGSSGAGDFQSVGDRAPQEDGGGGEFPTDGEAGPTNPDGDRMIIRTKVLRLEVEETPEAIDAVRDQTRAHGGTVSDMKVATDSDEWLYHYDENGRPIGDGSALRGWITVRVPTDSYERFVQEISDIGTVKYQSEATSDVTQQHVDMSARLANLRAQEERLREFFEAAENVTEMLAIEEELGRIRGEIESLDAQVTHLERQAAMATISIEMTEPRGVVPREPFGFSEAVRDGVRGAASVFNGMVTFVIGSAPLWILALVLYFPIRAIVRRRRDRDSQFPPPQGSPVREPVAVPPSRHETASAKSSRPGQQVDTAEPDEPFEAEGKGEPEEPTPGQTRD